LRKSKETTITSVTQRKEAKVIKTWKDHNFLFYLVTNKIAKGVSDIKCAIASTKSHIRKKDTINDIKSVAFKINNLNIF
jgi:hypothetical protein